MEPGEANGYLPKPLGGSVVRCTHDTFVGWRKDSISSVKFQGLEQSKSPVDTSFSGFRKTGQYFDQVIKK